MKKLETIVLLIAAVFFSVTSNASGFLTVNVIPGNNERALVSIANAGNNKFSVEVKDSFGDMVYYRNVKSSGDNFQKTYDFSKLEDGTYKFTVTLGGETEVSTLNVKDGKAKITEEQKTLAPYFAIKGDQLEISYLNFAQKGLKFKVYDDFTNELLFEENLSPDFAVHKAYNVSKLMNGKYTAVLETNDNTYDYNIRLK